jgi:hypothetical protein
MLQVFRKGGAQRLGDVEVPRLSDHGDDGRLGGEERLHVGILFHLLSHPAGHAERAQFRLLQPEIPSPIEKFLVFRVRSRVATLDVVDPEFVELFRDGNLVHHGQ